MRSSLSLLLMLCLWVSLGLGDLLAQPAGSGDQIYFYADPKTKSETSIKGTILEESIQGVKFKAEKNEIKIIPARSILWITYKNKSVDAVTFREGRIKEDRAALATRPADRKALLLESLEKFNSLVKKIDDPVNAKRFIAWKIADIKYRLADLEPDNKNYQSDATEALTAFATIHPDSWEVIPCLLALSQVQEREGNIEAARKTMETLSRIASLPLEIKRDNELMLIQLLLRSRRFSDAETKARELSKSLSPNDSQFHQVALYLIETQIGQNKLEGVEANLKKLIEGSSDAKIKALGHCFLGDYYRLKKQDEDAFWEYLKVEALYGQEKEEGAKALYWLSRLFESVQGSKVKATDCRTRLLDKTYSATEYQRKALSEKGATP